MFEPGSTAALVNRLLPVNGTYFVEVSASPKGPPNAPGAAFSVGVRSCPVTDVTPGEVAGRWDDGDCEFSAGLRGDVYRYSFAGAGMPGAATVVPPSDGCVLGLLSTGPQVPVGECSGVPLDMPVLSDRPQGFIVAPRQAAMRREYTARFAACSLALVIYGERRAASLRR